MDLRQQLIEFEGYVRLAYPDPISGAAPWTIGVGHTGPEVHEGVEWTDAQIDRVLDEDVAKARALCSIAYPWYTQMVEPRRAVLEGMVFQMGPARTHAFVNTLAAMRDRRYTDAANGMLASLWARQTPKRVKRLAWQMVRGVWAPAGAAY